MFKTNLFSGETYWETETTKTSTSGTVYTKSGQTWLGTNGDQVHQVGGQLMNEQTGVMSSWGDPFKDQK